MTLNQIVQLLRIDNTVNMDTRTVISGLLFMGQKVQNTVENALHSFEDIIKWLTHLKTFFELEVDEIPLNKLKNWVKTDVKFHHEENKYFEVIPIKVTIEGREVTKWMQPMIKAKQEGICVFIIKRINGIFHFLVQGKVECGNFDIVEMAPTVQCLTGNYKETGPGKLPYLDYVLNAGQDQIIYDVMQSEEGGRFYHEQNRNMIVEADETLSTDTSDNYIWLTLRQIQKFILFNNFFNIQARCLISALVTRENEFS
jgi:oxidase EvaA